MCSKNRHPTGDVAESEGFERGERFVFVVGQVGGEEASVGAEIVGRTRDSEVEEGKGTGEGEGESGEGSSERGGESREEQAERSEEISQGGEETSEEGSESETKGGRGGSPQGRKVVFCGNRNNVEIPCDQQGIPKKRRILDIPLMITSSLIGVLFKVRRKKLVK